MFRRIARLAGAVALSAGVVAVPAGAAFASPSYVDVITAVCALSFPDCLNSTLSAADGCIVSHELGFWVTPG